MWLRVPGSGSRQRGLSQVWPEQEEAPTLRRGSAPEEPRAGAGAGAWGSGDPDWLLGTEAAGGPSCWRPVQWGGCRSVAAEARGVSAAPARRAAAAAAAASGEVPAALAPCWQEGVPDAAVLVYSAGNQDSKPVWDARQRCFESPSSGMPPRQLCTPWRLHRQGSMCSQLQVMACGCGSAAAAAAPAPCCCRQRSRRSSSAARWPAGHSFCPPQLCEDQPRGTSALAALAARAAAGAAATAPQVGQRGSQLQGAPCPPL